MDKYFLIKVLTGFGNVIIVLICIQSVMSWFVHNLPPSFKKFYSMIASLTDPFIRPFRKLTMKFAYSTGIDFAPLFGIMAIQVVTRLLAVILITV